MAFDGSLSKAFSTTNVMDAWTSSVPTTPDSSDQIRTNAVNLVADVSGKNFHLPAQAAPPKDAVFKVGAEATNVDQMKAQNQAVQADYMATDALIKNTVIETMKEVAGPEAAAQVYGKLMPGSGPGMFAAAVTVADPTGMVGSLYSVLSAAYSEAKGPNDAKINEVIDKTLNRLREASEAAAQGDMERAQKLAPLPPGHDYSDVKWEELRMFMQRNPLNDPIMKQARDQQAALEAVENNNQLIDAQYATTGDLHEKAVHAVSTGDIETAKQMTANDKVEQAAVVNGIDEDQLMASIDQVKYNLETGGASGTNVHAAAKEVVWTKLEVPPPTGARPDITMGGPMMAAI